MRGIDFGGFQGFVGGAVGEGPGEGLAVGGEFGAGGVGEDVVNFAESWSPWPLSESDQPLAMLESNRAVHVQEPHCCAATVGRTINAG
jgi:hypothetical protein